MTADAERVGNVASRRAYTVSITPFGRDGQVDEPGLRAHLRRVAEPGLGVYVGGGGSGEGHSLTLTEQRRVLEIAVDEIGGRVPVRAMGAGQRHATDAIEFLTMASETGVEAIQIYSPEVSHGHDLQPDELHRFLDDVLAECAMPCVLSTHRSVGYALPPDVVDELALAHGHVVGINCTQDAGYLAALLARFAGRIDVHVGGERGALDAIALGASGFLSSTANLAPRLVGRISTALDGGGDLASTLRAYGDLLRLVDLLGGSGGVAALKAVLAAFGLPGGVPRPPLLPRDAAAVAHLVDDIGRSGLPATEGWR